VYENSIARHCLAKCFKGVELAYLEQQPQFENSVAAMDSIADLENATSLGKHLLSELEDAGTR